MKKEIVIILWAVIALSAGTFKENMAAIRKNYYAVEEAIASLDPIEKIYVPEFAPDHTYMKRYTAYEIEGEVKKLTQTGGDTGVMGDTYYWERHYYFKQGKLYFVFSVEEEGDVNLDKPSMAEELRVYINEDTIIDALRKIGESDQLEDIPNEKAEDVIAVEGEKYHIDFVGDAYEALKYYKLAE